MKILALFVCSLLLFTQQALSLSCPDGFYDSGAAKCQQCGIVFTACTSTYVNAPVRSSIVGWKYDSAGNPFAYCATGYYDKTTNLCQTECKESCKVCETDYDFCKQCDNGYVWNSDFTCIPATIGLQAASLALLVISVVFGIITCCLVIRAKKN